jgi:ABC-type sugar transport system substrate-binding protein
VSVAQFECALPTASAWDLWGGGGHGAGGHRRPVRIAWLGNDPANAYDNANRDQAAALARAKHGKVTPFYASFDPAIQLAQCQSVVNSRDFDAILIIPTDGVGILPCVENARRHRIPVVAVDLPIGSDFASDEPQARGQTGAVLTPAAKWGDSLASLVEESCASLATCDLAYIAGSVEIAFDQMALEQLDALTAAHPNIHLVAVEEAFYDEALAFDQTQAILAAHPNIQILIGAGDQMAKGAEEAIATMETAPADLKIVGAGAGAYGVDAVREGRWYATFVTLPGDEGRLGADIAIRAVRRLPIEDRGIDPVERRGYPAFFTRETEDEFEGFTPQWPG